MDGKCCWTTKFNLQQNRYLILWIGDCLKCTFVQLSNLNEQGIQMIECECTSWHSRQESVLWLQTISLIMFLNDRAEHDEKHYTQ